jgi:hypothetical protein
VVQVGHVVVVGLGKFGAEVAIALPPDDQGVWFRRYGTMRGRSMEWPRQSRIAVGSAASHGVSIVSSKLFPSILT